MDKLRIYQLVETLRITGNNSGSSTTMTGVSTGPCSGTSFVTNCSFRLLGIYVNFTQHRSPGTRATVNSGVSILLQSGVSTRYNTIIADVTLNGEDGLVFEPDSPLILPPNDHILVNIGRTDSNSANGNVTIHIGY